MPDGRARLVSAIVAPQAELPDQPQATVTSVAAGQSKDGQALVTVNYLGSLLQLPYKAHYTPAVGHVVTLIRTGGNWAIDGRLIGFPKPTV